MSATEIKTRDRLQKVRLERMRLGQSACSVVNLLSDDSVQVALVPLTEEEYDQAYAHAAAMDIPDSTYGNQYADRRNQQEILVRSMREPGQLDQRIFENADQLRKVLDVNDVNYLMDAYLELMEQTSPTVGAMTDEEVEELKKFLVEIPWSELTGGQWYALKRFLLTLSPEQLLGRFAGSFLINQ